jgi:hypothetical protein
VTGPGESATYRGVEPVTVLCSAQVNASALGAHIKEDAFPCRMEDRVTILTPTSSIMAKGCTRTLSMIWSRRLLNLATADLSVDTLGIRLHKMWLAGARD